MDGLQWVMENPIFFMDDLGVPLFLETPIYFHIHVIHIIHLSFTLCNSRGIGKLIQVPAKIVRSSTPNS